MIQRNRVYTLRVGNEERGWSIEDLNISFDITKTASNKDKANSAVIEVYNLSSSKRKYLEEAFIRAELYVGYESYGLVLLFSGEVTEVATKRSGGDIVTKLSIGNAYTEINYKTISKLVPAGRTVEDVINEVKTEIPSIANTVFTGVNIKSRVLDGYPISTSARKTLDDLSRSYEIDWQIDNDILYINDKNGSHGNNTSAVVVSRNTGLIERPYAVDVAPVSTKKKVRKEDNNSKRITKDGVQFKHLLNPMLSAGGLVKIEDSQFGGLYKVAEIRSYGEWMGSDWYSDVMCEKYGGA